jgi:hypothetical protein
MMPLQFKHANSEIPETSVFQYLVKPGIPQIGHFASTIVSALSDITVSPQNVTTPRLLRGHEMPGEPLHKHGLEKKRLCFFFFIH